MSTAVNGPAAGGVLRRMGTLARPHRILTASMAVTFLVMRAYLHWSPNTDFNVSGYNVHHLFSGVLLIAVCGIPAVSVPLSPRSRAIAIAGFGAGLAMAWMNGST
jgi:hypothetical protein